MNLSSILHLHSMCCRVGIFLVKVYIFLFNKLQGTERMKNSNFCSFVPAIVLINKDFHLIYNNLQGIIITSLQFCKIVMY